MPSDSITITLDLTHIRPDSATARSVMFAMADLWRNEVITAAEYQEVAEAMVSGAHLTSIINDIRAGNLGADGMRPIPALTRMDCIFGNIAHLPTRSEIPDADWSMSSPEAEVIRSLFFKGGSFAQYGYRPKTGVDVGAATQAIHAIMCSLEPSHEHKIVGCAVLLREWFEKGAVPKPQPSGSQQDQVRRAKKMKQSRKIRRGNVR